MPSWPGSADFAGPVLHSGRYKNGAAYAGKRVLVVGFGNSACEIALDLCEHGAHPTLAVRSAVNILPRDVLGVSILAIGIAMRVLPVKLADALGAPIARATVGTPEQIGLESLPYGPNEQVRVHGRIPLLDIGTVARIRSGDIATAPGIERFGAETVRFVDGRELPFDAVVLATGYRPALAEFLEGADYALDADGVPRRSGAESAPGLYFCGFYVSPSGMLYEIGREARRIAKAIAAR